MRESQTPLGSQVLQWRPVKESPDAALCGESRHPSFFAFLLQVDLRFLTVLTAIATQGAISRETQNGYYVKSYKLEVSTNGEDWMVYRHGKNHKVSPWPHHRATQGRSRRGGSRGAANPPHTDKAALLPKAPATDGGPGDTGPENTFLC